MSKSLRLLVFVLAASAVSLGLSAGIPGGSAIAADADDRAVEEKVAPFIECINDSDNELQGTFENYRRLLEDIKQNPRTSDVAFVGGFEGVDHGNKKSLKCADNLDKIAKATPEIDDLDRLAVDYAATIRTFVPLAAEADIYYHQQDYKDDNWAKGKALDDKLAPLIAKLESLSDNIHAAVEREVNGIRDRELAAVAAHEGKGFEWHTLHYMIEARKTLDAIEAMAGSRTLSPDKVGNSIAPLQAAFDDATAYAAAHADEMKPNSSGRVPGWVWIDHSASSYLKEVKDLRRKLEEKASQTNMKNSFESIVNSYNSLVDSYNGYKQHDS
ncbi:MAG TPA: DUF3829 domain-containing protein [Alphaproteobacteria bacterium]